MPRTVCRCPLLITALLLAAAPVVCEKATRAADAPVTLWDPAVPMPKAADLPRPEGTVFHVIKPHEPGADGYDRLHGVALAWHEGHLYVGYSNDGGRGGNRNSAELGVIPLAALGSPAGARNGAGTARVPHGRKDTGLQLAENPPMHVITRTPPEPPAVTDDFEVRDGFRVITTLKEFRAAIRKDGQKIRMKPGVYRAETVDPPMTVPVRRAEPGRDGQVPKNRQEHIFAVNGSNNHFDLRGAVFETPVSVQSRLSGKAHVADCWHINGSGNVFEGGYFRNVTDRPYPKYRVAENEFEVCGDNNTFRDCTFVIRGSVPYGYSDFYGKGGPNFGRLNKHSFMSISHANGTRLIGCRVYMQSFGHCVHFHTVDGARIERCFFSGALRPTNDIFRESVGRATEYDFHIMYRGKRPIPRDRMIPLTEDGVRSYNDVKNITVRDTTVERLRGCFQLLCTGDVTLENVTVREAGDFGYDLSAGDRGKVAMRNCRADLAYNPVFNLTRGPVPKGAFYEVTILSPAEGVQPTDRTSLGTIAGDRCTFIFHDGATRPLPKSVNVLTCGGKKRLANSTVVNHTTAKVILTGRTRNNVIRSRGPVEDYGKGNTVMRIGPARRRDRP